MKLSRFVLKTLAVALSFTASLGAASHAHADEMEMASLAPHAHNKAHQHKPTQQTEIILGTLQEEIVPNMLDSHVFTDEDWNQPRELTVFRPALNKTVTVVYWKEGKYVSSAKRELNRMMRDLYNGRARAMDNALYDALWAAQTIVKKFGYEGTIEVTSGYRSPATNDMLRAQGYKAAKNSLHIQGRAIDFRIPGISIKLLSTLMKSFNRGGVGTYHRHSGGWIHVDTGDVRSWRG